MNIVSGDEQGIVGIQLVTEAFFVKAGECCYLVGTRSGEAQLCCAARAFQRHTKRARLGWGRLHGITMPERYEWGNSSAILSR